MSVSLQHEDHHSLTFNTTSSDASDAAERMTRLKRIGLSVPYPLVGADFGRQTGGSWALKQAKSKQKVDRKAE